MAYRRYCSLCQVRSNPSFTLGNRYGKRLLAERWAGAVVDQVVVSFKKDSWLSVVGSIKASGKRFSTFTRESVAGFLDDASLTLAANPVDGATAAERLDNVHWIEYQVQVTLEWKPVVFSAVSNATPAVITIVAPGGTHTATTFRVYYNIGGLAWATLPARVSEPPLRCTDLQVIIGGKWDASSA